MSVIKFFSTQQHFITLICLVEEPASERGSRDPSLCALSCSFHLFSMLLSHWMVSRLTTRERNNIVRELHGYHIITLINLIYNFVTNVTKTLLLVLVNSFINLLFCPHPPALLFAVFIITRALFFFLHYSIHFYITVFRAFQSWVLNFLSR